MAASLTAEELGSSFAIQSYGDLAARRAAVFSAGQSGIVLLACHSALR